jgi:hypothetical protein
MKKYMKVAAISQDSLNKDARFITSNISNSSKASESVQSSLQSKKKVMPSKIFLPLMIVFQVTVTILRFPNAILCT